MPPSKLIASFEGVSGAHSNVVLDAFFNRLGLEYEPMGLPSLRHVANSVLTQQAHVGIIVIDNAIAGTVRDGYDLLAQYNLEPFAEIDWKMDHRLLAPKGAELSGIREVLAHPLVIGECGKFLAGLTGAKILPSQDTGVGAKEVSESNDKTRAAIAPPKAAKLYGLEEIAKNIADHPENFTRFLLFHAPKAAKTVTGLRNQFKSAQTKTSFIMSIANKSGALANCLNTFSKSGINLTKLESRPKLGKKWEYVFYVDFEGSKDDKKIAVALDKIKKNCDQLQVLGSYELCEFNIKEKPVVKKIEMDWEPTPDPAASKNYPKVARASNPKGTKISVGGVVIGGSDFTVIAGPCSVESEEQTVSAAKAVKKYGGVMLRGGAFKPRTNPYSFQGLGWEGVNILAEAGRITGLPTVSEVMSVDQVEKMALSIDVLQIGARNMQNFDLLKAVGNTNRVVLLKRGMSASLDELLSAAEYVLAHGNPNVILCERGIRTFETATRNTFDISAVPVLKERTHLPIFVDPSHAVGVKRWIWPMCRAAKAAGAHGMIVEVHPNPPEAKSDKDQALTFDDFEKIMTDLKSIPGVPGN